jgi:hypothetical protein
MSLVVSAASNILYARSKILRNMIEDHQSQVMEKIVVGDYREKR